MKRIWKNKQGVSPVIATILMVAITVVLAAVLYVMVSGYMTGGGGTPIAGSFTRDTSSTPNNGNATLRLAITTPSAPEEANIVVKLLDDEDNVVVQCAGLATNGANATGRLTWKHIASSSTGDTYETGDKLQVAFWGQDLSGYKISMTVDGYAGTVEYIFD
jgi:flagellin-like protein